MQKISERRVGNASRSGSNFGKSEISRISRFMGATLNRVGINPRSKSPGKFKVGGGLVINLLVAVVMMTVLVGAGGTAPVIKASPAPARYITQGDGSWFWQNPLPLGNNLNSVSCPGTTYCFAVGDGGTIINTSDGVTWSQQNLPPNLTKLSDLRSISCPSTQVCYAVGTGGTIVAAIDSPWTIQTSPTTQNLDGISCPSLINCFAVGTNGTIIATTDGINWAPQPAIPASLANIELKAISCSSTQVCYAVGAGGKIVAAVNSPWTIQNPANLETLNGLSCPVDGSSCFADGVGELVLWRTQFGWSTRLTGPTTLNGINCPDALNCFGVGDSGTVIASVNGSPFSLQAYPTTQNLKGITCPNNQVCYGVGANGTIVTTTNAGGVWTVTSYNSTIKDLKGVSCPSSTICYAVGSGGTIVKYNNNANNQIWYPQASSTTKDLNGISCPSEILCFAVGAKGTIIATTDGSTWAAQPNLPDTITFSDFLSISCPSSQVCYAAGTKGRVVAAVHSAWTDQFNPTGRDLSGISCPTETTCFAVGNNGPEQFTTTSDSGALWQPQNSPGGSFTTDLHAISCPSINVCYAAGDSGTIVAAINGPWTVQPGSTGSALYGISCTAVQTCTAVGPGGLTISKQGTGSWSRQDSGSIAYLDAVDCVVRCVSVGSSGSILADSQVVTSQSDNNASFSNTLTYALNRAGEKETIRFDLDNHFISLSHPLPPLVNGVKLIANCDPGGGPQVLIDASTAIVPSLSLFGNNTLSGIHLSGFSGPVLKVIAPDGGGFGVRLKCTKAEH